jgi:hypothetical protein
LVVVKMLEWKGLEEHEEREKPKEYVATVSVEGLVERTTL